MLNYTLCDVVAVPYGGLFDYKSKASIQGGHLIRQPLRADGVLKVVNDVLPFQEPLEFIQKSYYAGFLSGHYGHFLLESISRLRMVRECGAETLTWLVLRKKDEQLTAWQLEVFRLLGLGDMEHCFVTKPTLFKQMDLVDPGYIIRGKFNDDHKKFLSCVDIHPGGGKVWVSRSKESLLDGWVNEQEIEFVLAKKGWQIFHPQDYSIEDQVRIMASCDVLAGVAGSAFHTLLLAKMVFPKIILFSRGLKSSLNWNFYSIASAKSLFQSEFYPEQHFVSHVKSMKPGYRARERYRVNSSQVLGVLDL